MSEIPVYDYDEKITVPGRGDIYTGRCQPGMEGKLLGLVVRVDGKLRKVRAVEWRGSEDGGPYEGDLIGLLFYNAEIPE